MKKLKQRAHVLILSAILIFSFLTRVYRLAIPSTYYFDEVYHAVTAKLYARNDPSGYEWWHSAPEPKTAIEWLHPPIAKLFQAASMLIFGENSFGWRISSVIFGVLVIYMTYVLAKKLFNNINVGLLSAFLVSLDGLIFAQSRIAMNDIHVTFFILLSVYVYSVWKDKKTNLLLLLSGICVGLAMSTKWSGVYVVGILGLDQIINVIQKRKIPSRYILSRMLFSWIFIPFIVYVFSYGQFWLQGHTITQFKELHNQIIYYQTHLKATHPFQSTPIEWMLDFRPVWLYVQYLKNDTIGNIYNIGNPFIFYGGLISMFLLLYSVLFTKEKIHVKEKSTLLIISYCCVWMPWFLSPRIMFFYHYTPAVPFLSIAFAVSILNIIKTRKWKSMGYGLIGLTFIWFVVFFPYISGIPMPRQFIHDVYQRIPSWR